MPGQLLSVPAQPQLAPITSANRGRVAVIAGIAGLGCYVGVVGLAIHVVADTVAVGIADAGAGGGGADAVAIAIHPIVDSSIVAVVTGIAKVGGQPRAVVSGRRIEKSTHSWKFFTGRPSKTLPPGVVPSIRRAMELPEV